MVDAGAGVCATGGDDTLDGVGAASGTVGAPVGDGTASSACKGKEA